MMIIVSMKMMGPRDIWRWKLGLKGRPTTVEEVVGSDDAGGHHQTRETSETHSFYIALTCVPQNVAAVHFPPYFSLWWPLTLTVCPHFLHRSCSWSRSHGERWKCNAMRIHMMSNSNRYFILVRTNSNVKMFGFIQKPGCWFCSIIGVQRRF